MTDIPTHKWPEWATDQYFRPTDTLTNVDRMRKEATNAAVAGRYAVIHHHAYQDACRKDFKHEYFGFGPHPKCNGDGCYDCHNTGWRKH